MLYISVSPSDGERGDEQRHARAHVGALHAPAAQRRRPDDHHPVRVAEDDLRAHVLQVVDEEHAALEHLLEEQHGAFALRRDGDHDGHQVRREGGQGASSIFGMWP
jgi:hypothetical protein